MPRFCSLVVRISIVVLVAAGMLLPAVPAGAHGRLPAGKYACYIYDGYTMNYSYFDLHIRRNNRYVLKLGADPVGAPGRFVHSSTGERVRFRTGYLAEEGYKGFHRPRSRGDQTIILMKRTSLGTMEYDCTD